MKHTQLFHSYEFLVDRADAAFRKMEKEYRSCIKCERHCSDCCHAVFGLFLIEAAYLKQHFDLLDRTKCQEALLRCNNMDRDLKRLEIKLQTHEDDPQMHAYIMAKERIRCPLLDDEQDCILYHFRPITCRVYGIPTKIQGKAHVCGRSGYKKREHYPAFDLDGVYQNLFTLSEELMNSAGCKNSDKASLLISVSKAITTPLDCLIHEKFG